MNLIGHYACAASSDAEVRLGAVVPDLASVYRRKVRPLALARSWHAAADAQPVPGMTALLEGVAFHHAVDLRFHRAPLFTDLEAALATALREASDAPGLKRFLPAHVLAELYLDHLLLQEDEALGAGFYRDVARGRGLLTTFVARHPQADRSSFEAFLEHVLRERFVDAYQSHAGILGRMNRILVRFGQRPLGAAEQHAITACFGARETETATRLAAFIAEMRALPVSAGGTAPAGSQMSEKPLPPLRKVAARWARHSAAARTA